MHRLLKVWNRRIPYTATTATTIQLRQSFSCLKYSTAATTISAVDHHPFNRQRPNAGFSSGNNNNNSTAWREYLELKPDQLKEWKREDFLKLRADLWKQRNWGIEDCILQVLGNMKSLGHAWSTNEYNEYFTAKLFKAQYADILDTYHGEFQQQKQKLSIGSFNVVLATFIQLGQIDDAVQFIQEASTKFDVLPDIRDFDRTMSRCMLKNTHVIQVAKELIAEHGFQSAKVLNSNLLHLFREKRISDIKWIYQQIKLKKLDIATFNILIKGYVDARLMRDATQTYNDMLNQGIKPNSYICASMLSIYAHTRDLVSAESVVRETVRGGHRPDEALYNQLIKVYFKCRQSQKAFRAFQEIEKDPSLKMNDIILNTMINGLIINKEFHIAGLLYKQMIRSEYKPDMVTFNTMLKGYIKTGDMASAGGIIADMFKLGMEPDTVTFTTLINSVFKNKAPQTAEEMMGLISQMGMTPNIYTYNAVINGWIEGNKIDQAEKTLELMRSAHMKPTIHTFTNLIQGYVEQMNLGKAMETFQLMMRSGVQPDRATFNFMITGFLEHDRLSDAYSCLEHMVNMNLNPTKDTWKLILDECCQKKDWRIGQKIVEKLDQSGFVIKSDSLRRPYTIVKSHCT